MSTPLPAAGARQRSRSALALPAAQAARLEQLSTPDGRIFGGLAALYLAAWAAGVALVTEVRAPLGLLLLSAFLGSQLHALTVLQHDCGHRSAFRSTAANLWVGRLLAVFVYMPFTTFTELHRRHHGFLGQADGDPDEWFYEGGKARLFLRECLFMPRFIVLSLTRLADFGVRRRVVAELAANTAVHSAVVLGLLASGQLRLLVFGYAVPLLWLACVFNPISRGFEHLPLAELPAGDPARHDLRHNTITVSSRWVGLLWANIGFHVEHHMYPRVPFHRLPALHALFADKAYRVARYPLGPVALRGMSAPPLGARLTKEQP
jgi:fatty acid desaturase